MKIVTMRSAANMLGYSTTQGLQKWIDRYNNKFPYHRVLRIGHRIDMESLEEAILRFNGRKDNEDVTPRQEFDNLKQLPQVVKKMDDA